MPTKKFALEREGPKRVEISWKGIYKNLDVRVDGQSIGVLPNKAALKAGPVMTLPDGSRLSLKLKQGAFSSNFELLHDGVPLPGSDTDPRTQVKAAAQVIYFIAALNALFGALVLIFDVKALVSMAGAYGIGAFFMAGVYSVLAFFAMGGATWALIATITLYSVDWIYGLIASLQAGGGGTGGGGGFVMRIFILTFLVRAVGPSRALRKERKAAQA